MRSIDADAIYDTLSDIFIEYLATSSNTDTRNALDSLYHTVLSAVETAPTVSPDEVRGVGEWICDPISAVSPVEEWYCNICKQPAPMGYGKAYVRTNYCPSCGAKMEVTSDVL